MSLKPGLLLFFCLISWNFNLVSRNFDLVSRNISTYYLKILSKTKPTLVGFELVFSQSRYKPNDQLSLDSSMSATVWGLYTSTAFLVGPQDWVLCLCITIVHINIEVIVNTKDVIFVHFQLVCSRWRTGEKTMKFSRLHPNHPTSPVPIPEIRVIVNDALPNLYLFEGYLQGWMDIWLAIVRPFKQYFSQIRTTEG